MDELDRLVRVGLLYDHYGPLLTAHQREAVDLYYLRNWSLQEIAESWSTSRQAVHDLVSRSVRLLDGYEGRLGLAERERRTREILQGCARQIEEARTMIGRDDRRAGEMLAAAAASVATLLGADEDSGGGSTGVS